MFSCSCGRHFNSEAALDQHQVAKGRVDGVVFNCRASVTGRASREDWIWKDTFRRAPVHTIDLTELEPPAVQVSSTAASELLCTYNWQDNKEGTIQVPGIAPVWRDVPLPITLPEDRGTFFVDQNAARIPRYPFAPMFEAMTLMNPEFCFNDVDIVVNRNSLRKLLDFCAGRNQESFRVNLLMVHNTLFIERCEKSARQLIRGAQSSGWGRNFERTFTKYPSGTASSTGHHRVLRYPLGNLNCVVRFEVDACYRTFSEDRTEELTKHSLIAVDPRSLVSKMGKLSIGKPGNDSKTQFSAMDAVSQASVMPQSTTAEIKTAVKPKSLGSYLPQLWFGRTPWLIMGRHTGGTFHEVKITNVAAHFLDWETRYQTELHKLVAVLSQLRELVKNEGRNCVAIYQRDSVHRTIKIFASTAGKQALPDALIRQFWVSEKSAVATNLSPRKEQI